MPDTEPRVREYWSQIVAENPPPDADDLIRSTRTASVTIANDRVRPIQPRASRGRERQRWVMVAVSAAAVVLFLVIAPVAFFAGDNDPDAGNTVPGSVATVSPASVDGTSTGLLGLPPLGATPSRPEAGELVASMYQHIRAGQSFGDSWLYLYGDGRLIWARGDQARWHCSPVCSGSAADVTGGWFEQRLSSEGVELIQSVIVATGLFDLDEQRSRQPTTGNGYIQVHNGGRLVFQGVVPELLEQLAQLWTWLPADVWEEAEPKAFVPSLYAVCFHVGGHVKPVDPAGYLDQLPTEAQDLLAGSRQLQPAELATVDPGGLGGMHLWSDASGGDSSPGHCFEVSTEQARAFSGVLRDAGVEELEASVAYLISGTRHENSAAVYPDAAVLSLWPMLPHGVPAFTGG